MLTTQQEEERRSEIEDIKSRLDILDVVGRYVKLQKSGNVYQGLCPFHHEDTPSFTVYPKTQSFYCFGCHAGEKGGDVLDFIGKIEGIEFKDVVAKLRSGSGITLSAKPISSRPIKKTEEKTEIDPKMLVLYEKVYEVARQALLKDKSKEAEEVRAYLSERGFKEEHLRILPIGAYLPQHRDYFFNNFDKDLVRKSGLVSYGKGYNYRLIFPHYDLKGKLIGLAFRLVKEGVDKEGKPLRKYKFTPDFDKDIPYNLYHATIYIRKQNEVIVVEGQLDVDALMLNGVHNAVCIGGNHLMDDQKKNLIGTGAKNILFWLDNDEPGVDGCTKAIKSMISENGVTTFVVSTSHKDVGEINKLSDREPIIQASIGSAVLGVSWLAKQMANVDGDREKQRVLDEAKEVYESIKDVIQKREFVKGLAKGLGYKMEHISKLYGGTAPKANKKLTKGKNASLVIIQRMNQMIKQKKNIQEIMDFLRAFYAQNKAKLPTEAKKTISTLYDFCQKYMIAELKQYVESQLKELSTKLM